MRNKAVPVLEPHGRSARRIGATLLVATAALVSLCSPLAAQERCSDESVLELRGVVQDRGVTTVGAADWRASKADVKAMLEHSRPLMDLILRLDEVARPKGMQVGWNRAVGHVDPGRYTLEQQPVPMTVEAMLIAFVCKDGRVVRRWSDAEAGIWVSVNSLGDVLGVTDSTIGGKPVYALYLDVGEKRGRRVFMPPENDPRDRSTFERSVLVTRPGRQPFRYVTRGEFLDSLAAEVEKDAAGAGSGATMASYTPVRLQAEQEAALKKRIKEIEGYQISESAKQARIRRLLADYKTDEQERADTAARVDAIHAARRKRLEQIRGGLSAEELRAPAVIQAKTSTSHGLLSNPDWGFADPKTDARCFERGACGQHLVTLDESYFDPKLPRSAPQFFVVSFFQRGLPELLPPAMRGLRDGALERFDFDALAALLPK